MRMIVCDGIEVSNPRRYYPWSCQGRGSVQVASTVRWHVASL